MCLCVCAGAGEGAKKPPQPPLFSLQGKPLSAALLPTSLKSSPLPRSSVGSAGTEHVAQKMFLQIHNAGREEH